MIALFVIFDLLAIPAFAKFCFGDIAGFFKSLYYGAKPNIISLVDGDLQKDMDWANSSRLFAALTGGLLLFEVWVVSGIK